MASTFQANLRTARVALGMSQAEMGDLLGASQVSISRWERGETYPSGCYERLYGVTLLLLAQDLDLSAVRGTLYAEGPMEALGVLLDIYRGRA